jgi:hypothetical protein
MTKPKVLMVQEMTTSPSAYRMATTLIVVGDALKRGVSIVDIEDAIKALPRTKPVSGATVA